jgi:hypothetical protein
MGFKQVAVHQVCLMNGSTAYVSHLFIGGSQRELRSPNEQRLCG